MTVRAIALSGLLLLASAANAKEPFEVHGLIVGNEGARYVKGVPTLDLQQHQGAIQLRSFGFHNNRPVFAIAFYNAGPEPVNIGLEDIHVSTNGVPLRVFDVKELQRQAKNDAWWNAFGLALAGGVAAASAASARDYSSGTISGPYGTYRIHTSYPSLYGQIQADRITTNTAWGIAAIQYQLDATLERLGDHVVQRTTVDPGQSYAGMIVLDKLKKGKPPFELRLDVDWNGERYPFAYVLERPGKPVPQQYAAMLAANAKPRALNAQFVAPAAGASAEGAPPPMRTASTPAIKGSIYLKSGAVKIPAKTRSGYCLKTPYGYRGTGATESPVISGALPRCLDDSGTVADQYLGSYRRY